MGSINQKYLYFPKKSSSTTEKDKTTTFVKIKHPSGMTLQSVDFQKLILQILDIHKDANEIEIKQITDREVLYIVNDEEHGLNLTERIDHALNLHIFPHSSEKIVGKHSLPEIYFQLIENKSPETIIEIGFWYFILAFVAVYDWIKELLLSKSDLYLREYESFSKLFENTPESFEKLIERIPRYLGLDAQNPLHNLLKDSLELTKAFQKVQKSTLPIHKFVSNIIDSLEDPNWNGDKIIPCGYYKNGQYHPCMISLKRKDDDLMFSFFSHESEKDDVKYNYAFEGFFSSQTTSTAEAEVVELNNKKQKEALHSILGFIFRLGIKSKDLENYKLSEENKKLIEILEKFRLEGGSILPQVKNQSNKAVNPETLIKEFIGFYLHKENPNIRVAEIKRQFFSVKDSPWNLFSYTLSQSSSLLSREKKFVFTMHIFYEELSLAIKGLPSMDTQKRYKTIIALEKTLEKLQNRWKQLRPSMEEFSPQEFDEFLPNFSALVESLKIEKEKVNNEIGQNQIKPLNPKLKKASEHPLAPTIIPLETTSSSKIRTLPHPCITYNKEFDELQAAIQTKDGERLNSSLDMFERKIDKLIDSKHFEQANELVNEVLYILPIPKQINDDPFWDQFEDSLLLQIGQTLGKLGKCQWESFMKLYSKPIDNIQLCNIANLQAILQKIQGSQNNETTHKRSSATILFPIFLTLNMIQQDRFLRNEYAPEVKEKMDAIKKYFHLYENTTNSSQQMGWERIKFYYQSKDLSPIEQLQIEQLIYSTSMTRIESVLIPYFSSGTFGQLEGMRWLRSKRFEAKGLLSEKVGMTEAITMIMGKEVKDCLQSMGRLQVDIKPYVTGDRDAFRFTDGSEAVNFLPNDLGLSMYGIQDIEPQNNPNKNREAMAGNIPEHIASSAQVYRGLAFNIKPDKLSSDNNTETSALMYKNWANPYSNRLSNAQFRDEIFVLLDNLDREGEDVAVNHLLTTLLYYSKESDSYGFKISGTTAFQVLDLLFTRKDLLHENMVRLALELQFFQHDIIINAFKDNPDSLDAFAIRLKNLIKEQLDAGAIELAGFLMKIGTHTHKVASEHALTENLNKIPTFTSQFSVHDQSRTGLSILQDHARKKGTPGVYLHICQYYRSLPLLEIEKLSDQELIELK